MTEIPCTTLPVRSFISNAIGVPEGYNVNKIVLLPRVTLQTTLAAFLAACAEATLNRSLLLRYEYCYVSSCLPGWRRSLVHHHKRLSGGLALGENNELFARTLAPSSKRNSRRRDSFQVSKDPNFGFNDEETAWWVIR